MDGRPVGVFDSGMGGIPILRRAMNELPQENFVYYGDHANVPYGGREGAQIRELALCSGKALAGFGVKAILLGCNTVTAASIDLLRSELPIPVVGIEPAIVEAASLPGNGLILMLATQATTKFPYYRRLRATLADPNRVADVPCPVGIVQRVEEGKFTPGSYTDILDDVLHPYEGMSVDGIVLGCTHYQLIRDEIRRYAKQHFQGPQVLYDGGRAAVNELKATLAEQGIANTNGSAQVEFYTSADRSTISPMFYHILDMVSGGNCRPRRL